MTFQMHSRLHEFLQIINKNFRQEAWKLREIGAIMEKVDQDIYELSAKNNVPPQYIVKLRTELGNIDVMSNRVETLKETTFIPAAYSISEITVGMVLIMLLFVRIDPFYAGFLIYGITAFLFVGLLMLIKQIDNPFAVRKHTYATVDLSILFKLEERMFPSSRLQV